ncbi:MAG: AbrB family transcriptional regulator [Candidatus Aenigmarchaeota archaeon]|nr:AbrB family transcriptional regulator [Candidatus Aenigmarchaeota archaeon]
MSKNEAVISCDDRGRVLLPQEVRKQYGNEFHLVRTRDELLLIPVSKNPIRELAELGRKAGIARLSLSRLKEEIRKQAEKEL